MKVIFKNGLWKDELFMRQSINEKYKCLKIKNYETVERNWVFSTNSECLIPMALDVVDLRYFKL